MAVCPVVPFGVFRAMHITEPTGERRNSVAVTLQAALLESVLSTQTNLHSQPSVQSVGTPVSTRTPAETRTHHDSQTIHLDNPLSLRRNDIGIVTRGSSSLIESVLVRRQQNYSALLAASSVGAAEADIYAASIPDSIRFC